MRTTIELPDVLYRKAKAAAVERGISMRQLVVTAIEREIQTTDAHRVVKPNAFPILRLKHKKILDLAGFNFDELLP